MKARLNFAELEEPPRKPQPAPPKPPVVPSFKDMDTARQPIAALQVLPIEAFSTLDHSVKLTKLTGKALDRADEILEALPDSGSETYGDDMRAVTSTIKTVLGTQLRVDENHLRRKAIDNLPALLKEVLEAEKALSARTINP